MDPILSQIQIVLASRMVAWKPDHVSWTQMAANAKAHPRAIPTDGAWSLTLQSAGSPSLPIERLAVKSTKPHSTSSCASTFAWIAAPATVAWAAPTAVCAASAVLAALEVEMTAVDVNRNVITTNLRRSLCTSNLSWSCNARQWLHHNTEGATKRNAMCESTRQEFTTHVRIAIQVVKSLPFREHSKIEWRL